jgi:hypothetical protein
MIPYIKKNPYPEFPEYNWAVVGKYGTDLVKTRLHAILFWLWHCGVNPKYLFKNDSNFSKTRMDVKSK